MTRSDRVFRVLIRLGIASATAACGLSMAGELQVPDGSGGIGTGANSRHSQNGDDAGDASESDADDFDPDGASGFEPDGAFAGDDSGSPGSSSSGGPAHGGAEAGPGPTVPCNFNGMWATKLTIPVNWVPQGIMGVILQPGSGTINQWILGSRVQSGTTLTDTTYVCGVDLPDFAGTVVAGAEAYGINFPDSLFDSNYLSSFTINGTLSAATTNAKYSPAAAAALLGIDLASPATAPWPSAIDALAESVDTDHDGNPGVTAFAATGAGYSFIPTDIYKTNRATAVFVVIRQVTQVSGTVVDCNHISGSVTIPQLTDSNGDSKYAIDSHVIGCDLEGDAGTCNDLQWSFLDGTQPVFSPTGSSTFASVRMPASTTCSQVRAMLP
jgi:hypothetical protein